MKDLTKKGTQYLSILAIKKDLLALPFNLIIKSLSDYRYTKKQLKNLQEWKELDNFVLDLENTFNTTLRR